MHAQSFGRPDFSTDELGAYPQVVGVPWCRALHELYALNSTYLELLACATEWGDFVTLTPSIAQDLRRLAPHQVALIASCPFSLFDARFEEHDLWLSACLHAQTHRSVEGRPIESRHHKGFEFAQAVLFLAWHLANARSRNGEVGARLLLGMHAATLATLRRVSLAILLKLAPPLVRVLEPRWQTHTQFWPGLIRSALQNDLTGLRRFHWLGRQLLAAQRRTPPWC